MNHTPRRPTVRSTFRTATWLAVAALSSVTLLGCATAPGAVGSPAAGLGDSKATAIEVCRPQGQRAYLDRLQCSDASVPSYRRVGSFGQRSDPAKPPSDARDAQMLDQLSGRPLKPGEPDYHIVDGYEVVCGATKRMIYMDMYHCDKPPPTEVPQGFQLRRAGRVALAN